MKTLKNVTQTNTINQLKPVHTYTQRKCATNSNDNRLVLVIKRNIKCSLIYLKCVTNEFNTTQTMVKNKTITTTTKGRRATRELKTMCGHMMPPQVYVCNELAGPADAAYHMYCEICSHSSHSTIGLTSIWIVCHMLLPCSWYNFSQNVNSSSIGGSD